MLDLLTRPSSASAQTPLVSYLTQEEGGMASVSINKAAIAQMMRDIQREFDKHTIKVSVESDGSFPTGNTTIFNGPVIHGDANGAQLAGEQDGHPTSPRAGRSGLSDPGPSSREHATAAPRRRTVSRRPARRRVRRTRGASALTQGEPDSGVLRRAVAALKGHLAQLAAGLAIGAKQGAQEWAKTAIQHLHFPF